MRRSSRVYLPAAQASYQTCTKHAGLARVLRTDTIDAVVLRAEGKTTLHHSMQRRAQRRLRVIRMQVARALHATQHRARGHVGAGRAPAGRGTSLRLRRPAQTSQHKR